MEGEAPRFFKPTGQLVKEFVLFRWGGGSFSLEIILKDGLVIYESFHTQTYINFYIKRGELEEITEAEAALILSLIPPLRYGK